VGFSLGGGPALALAAARPERITHLVLADVGTGADDAWRIQWLARRWVDFAERTGWDELVPDMLRSELFKFYANRGPRFRRHMAELIRATPLVGLRHTLSQVLAQRKSLFRMRHALQAIKVPTLVMLGQHDHLCRNAARLLSENIPGAVLHRIDGAGHMSPLERPDQFSDVLAAFFARGGGSHLPMRYADRRRARRVMELAPPTPAVFPPAERRLIRRLRTPILVQRFLNRLPYNTETAPDPETLRSFREVLRHRRAHCL